LNEIRTCAIVVKPLSTSKSDLEVLAKQVAQITTKCCRNNILVVDIIVTTSNLKDVTKRVASLTEHSEVKYLFFYSAKTIAKNEKEFLDFVEEMSNFYNIDVKRMK